MQSLSICHTNCQTHSFSNFGESGPLPPVEVGSSSKDLKLCQSEIATDENREEETL